MYVVVLWIMEARCCASWTRRVLWSNGVIVNAINVWQGLIVWWCPTSLLIFAEQPPIGEEDTQVIHAPLLEKFEFIGDEEMDMVRGYTCLTLECPKLRELLLRGFEVTTCLLQAPVLSKLEVVASSFLDVSSMIVPTLCSLTLCDRKVSNRIRLLSYPRNVVSWH